MTATVPGHIYARDGRMLQQHIDLEIFTIAFLIAVLSFLVRTFIGTSYSHIPSLSIGLRLFSFFNKSENYLLFSVFGDPSFCYDSSFRFSLPTSVPYFSLTMLRFLFLSTIPELTLISSPDHFLWMNSVIMSGSASPSIVKERVSSGFCFSFAA